MIYSGKLHILRPPNVPGKVSTMLDVDHITSAMQDQRGDADCWKHGPDIDTVVHAYEGLGGPRANACSFNSPH